MTKQPLKIRKNLKDSNGQFNGVKKGALFFNRILRSYYIWEYWYEKSFKKLNYIKDIFNRVEKPIYILEIFLSYIAKIFK